MAVYRHRKKLHVLFERVPALVCRACGHRIFDATAVETMEQALNTTTPGERAARLEIVSP